MCLAPEKLELTLKLEFPDDGRARDENLANVPRFETFLIEFGVF